VLRRALAALAALAAFQARAVPLTQEPGRLIYLVYLRAFWDGSAAPDGEGDFAGLTAKLDYLSELGVGAVLLMPVYASTGGMGYIPRDYLAPERAYGDEAAFTRLVFGLHARGIKVILDSPFNHISWDSPWFLQASAKACGDYCDYFYFTPDPGATPPYQYWHKPWDYDRTGVDAVFFQRPRFDPAVHRPERYYATFGQGMPDLRFWSFEDSAWNEPVVQEIERALQHWAALGADAFRIDAAKHFVEGERTNADPVEPRNRALLKRFLATARGAAPDVSFVGEIWADYSQIEPYFPDALDGAFDFPFMSAVRDSVQNRYGEELKGVLTHLAATQATIPPGRRVVFASNHDVDRLATLFHDDDQAARQAQFLTMLTPFPPMIYYGEELGMHGHLPATVAAFPWTGAANAGFPGGKAPVAGVPDNAARKNLAAARADQSSLFNFIKRLSGIRRDFGVTNATRLVVRGDLYGHTLGWTLLQPDGPCLTVLTNFHPTDTYAIDPKPADPRCQSGRADREVIRENATRNADGTYALSPFARVVILR
jgi:glycosidase